LSRLQIFAVVQVIVSIAVAAANNNADGGYTSASFAALWSMFLTVGFTFASSRIVFNQKSTELLVGFMIGMAFMLAELFFVLMCVFFILGSEADTNNYSESTVFFFYVLNLLATHSAYFSSSQPTTHYIAVAFKTLLPPTKPMRVFLF
jgi:hypothetical protein